MPRRTYDPRKGRNRVPFGLGDKAVRALEEEVRQQARWRTQTTTDRRNRT